MTRELSGISWKTWDKIDKLKERLMVNGGALKANHDARLMIVSKKNKKKDADKREEKLQDIERTIRRLETQRDELEQRLRGMLK